MLERDGSIVFEARGEALSDYYHGAHHLLHSPSGRLGSADKSSEANAPGETVE
jgi:hypothetical protein